MSEIYLSKDYYDKFLEFNITNFKRPNYKKRFEFQFFKNVYLENNSFQIAAITVNNLNEINGQFLVTPSKYVLNDLVKNCYFGSDYFVEENSRSSLAGFYLLKKVISDYSPQIAIGSTEVAIKILKLMHYPYIGNINKYFWFRKIPYRGLNKSKRKSEAINNFNYPDTLSIDNNKVHKYNFKDKISDYNVENIIFFERTPDFLKWRFSSELYGVYKIHLPENENNYFVVRVTNWKFLRLIILIDYRFDIRNVYVFGLMLKCCKKLAKIVHIL